MDNCLSGKNSTIPDEFRSIAQALFPGPPSPASAAGFAQELGIGAEYQRLLGAQKNNNEIQEFLGHFQNNLDLLIQKTWVEKAEESRKDKLQDDVLPFIELITRGKYQDALKEFNAILEELAYLLFGTESKQDDFTEYTFRIDTQMGLFWWYGSQLGSLEEMLKTRALNDETLWAILLIGLCYLTNF